MAFPPINPKQWYCTQCTWKDNHIQKSDCLTPHPEQCPQCGNKNFELQNVSPLENLLDKVGNLFR